MGVRVASGIPPRVVTRRPGRRSTVWAVSGPEALAYATIAGVSPVVGLYAAPERCCSTRPSGVASSYRPDVGHGGPFGGDRGSLVTGRQRPVRDLYRRSGDRHRARRADRRPLRFGFLANFISEPVMKGFIVGLALTIIVGQLPEVLRHGVGLRRLFPEAWSLITELGDTQVLHFVVGLASFTLSDPAETPRPSGPRFVGGRR